MNKNDNPILDFENINFVNFNNFKYKDIFYKFCDLYPNIEKERIEIANFDKDNINKTDLVYCFVYKNNLLKIGSTTTSFKNRVQSYNCGKKKYREIGTCSTTNYFVLQSLLNLKETIEVYIYFPEKQKVMFLENEEIKICIPSKVYEKKMLEMLKKENKMPILCTQV